MAANAPRPILVVEDNATLAGMLCRHIEQHTPHVAFAVGDGHEAVDQILADDPLLVVLDIGLPGLDGFQVCRRVRPRYTGPILFLTGEKKDEAHLEGFRSGGDDYVIKPASMQVVMAHIESLLRRAAQAPNPTTTSSGIYNLDQLEPVRTGDLTIDPLEQTLTTADGQTVSLAPAEIYLLWLLGRSAGEPVSRDAICQALQGKPWDGLSRMPDMLVSKIRKKLAKLDGDPVRIDAVKWVGYVLLVRKC